MSTYWRIDANGGWTFEDADLADDIEGYIKKILSGSTTYIVTIIDLAPDPLLMQYGSYAYCCEQVFALYANASDISLDQLRDLIKQGAEGLTDSLIYRDEYKLFRFFPLTLEEFQKQTEYYKD